MLPALFVRETEQKEKNMRKSDPPYYLRQFLVAAISLQLSVLTLLLSFSHQLLLNWLAVVCPVVIVPALQSLSLLRCSFFFLLPTMFRLSRAQPVANAFRSVSVYLSRCPRFTVNWRGAWPDFWLLWCFASLRGSSWPVVYLYSFARKLPAWPDSHSNKSATSLYMNTFPQTSSDRFVLLYALGPFYWIEMASRYVNWSCRS